MTKRNPKKPGAAWGAGGKPPPAELIVERGELPCWTVKRTRRGRIVSFDEFDPPPDMLATGVAGQLLAQMLVKMIRSAAPRGHVADVDISLRWRVLSTLRRAAAVANERDQGAVGSALRGAASGFVWAFTTLAVHGAASQDGERLAAAAVDSAMASHDRELQVRAAERARFLAQMAAGRRRRAAAGSGEGQS